MHIRRAVLQDAEAIARVHVDSWRTTYKGIVPDEYLNSLSYKERTERWVNTLKRTDTNVVFVAEDGDGSIVGFCSGGKERTGKFGEAEGELYAIYILEAHHRKGLGKKLVRALAEQLNGDGYQSMLIWVLEKNRSKYFYENLGGTFALTKSIEIGGSTLVEAAYRWEDLGLLCREE
ncbi:GNAT family N-acetyltransferase [Paenibacillus thermotolerans]|uniref:GNAT family N-acetyltransferase n=1 Tax=Paenibacillus thermotolerans TaxID=3027807 RepID=UPI002368D8D6|nr:MULTISPECIES: GNAT family N-acetyltransferase [unclassified Paenibacillus]